MPGRQSRNRRMARRRLDGQKRTGYTAPVDTTRRNDIRDRIVWAVVITIFLVLLKLTEGG